MIAVFVDFENLALGVRDLPRGSDSFKVGLVLKRLLERGRIVYKRAYCDWTRYRGIMHEFHSAGIEMVDIPQSRTSGKNSADIHMVVDALDLCYQKEHIDIFALLSGDSDFSPLVSKLKENDKLVIGCGVKRSTSELLINSCDEFIFYDDLVRVASRPKRVRKATRKGDDKKSEECAERLLEVVAALERDYDVIWGSMIKQTIRRMYPSFSESYYGYASFTALLRDMNSRGVIGMELDQARGNFKVWLKTDDKPDAEHMEEKPEKPGSPASTADGKNQD